MIDDAAPGTSASRGGAASWRSLVVVTALLATGAGLPVIMLGAFTPLVRPVVQATPDLWGWIVATYYGVSALVSVPAGRLAQRLPGRLALAVGGTGSALSLAGVAFVTRGWHLVAALTVAGFASALVHPAANLALARGVPRRALGPAFGAKQASVPFAATIAGFALPVAGLTLGWRATFVLVAAGSGVVVVGALLVVPHHPVASEVSRDIASRVGTNAIRVRGAVGMLAVGAGFGVAGNTALNAFFVQSVVDAGVAVAEAGVMLGIGSGAAIAGRLFWGFRLNGRDGPALLQATGTMIVVGALGLMMLATSSDRWLLWLAALATFVTVGAWNGVFELAVVELHPNAPAAATGVTATGMRAGGLLGPVVFGLVATQTSIRVAWMAIAAGCLVGAIVLLIGRVQLARETSVTSGCGANP